MKKMKIQNKFKFYFGFFIGIFLLISYFINFDVDSGSNYIVKDSLLGVLIFHNPFILGIYVFIVVALILSGFINIRLKKQS